jgi:hypothetical protein
LTKASVAPLNNLAWEEAAAAQDKCEAEIGQAGNCLKEAQVLNIVYRLIGLVARRNTHTHTQTPSHLLLLMDTREIHGEGA